MTAVKGDLEGYRIVELKDGKWICDCFHYAQSGEFCEHIYAAQLARKANRSYETEISPSDEDKLKCRYCGSLDISRCGFRYNARGISRRYYCHECERKFSIRIIESQQAISNVPAEVVWLLDEIGLQMSRLNELLVQLDSRLAQFLIQPKA
jgi:transcription elongation factor Elf1